MSNCIIAKLREVLMHKAEGWRNNPMLLSNNDANESLCQPSMRSANDIDT